MFAAVAPFAADGFITPMAAVAGAVAEAVLEAMTAAAPLDRAYVNDGGDIALHLARRARRRGVTLRPLALERHPVAARLCRRAGVPAVIADGGVLPLANASVDVVLASQLLHHLARDSAIVLLRELARVARVGVIVADLRRHAVAATGITCALDRVPALGPEMGEDVIRGCAMPEAGQGMNVARQAALLAGIPSSAAAMPPSRR